MKFGQLIGHDMRNIFLEISYTKCGAKLVLHAKFSVSLDQQSDIL